MWYISAFPFFITSLLLDIHVIFLNIVYIIIFINGPFLPPTISWKDNFTMWLLTRKDMKNN